VTIDVLMEWLPVIGETERLKDFMQQRAPKRTIS
jgi:hypothetical protein